MTNETQTKDEFFKSLNDMSISSTSHLNDMNSRLESLMPAIGSMIQFDGETNNNDDPMSVYVSEHPDPLQGNDKKTCWMAFEYELDRIKRSYEPCEVATAAAMFIALWEIAVVYKVPPMMIHKQMMKIKEYYNVFHCVK